MVINHGVSKVIVDEIKRVAHEFFSLPVEEKMKLYSDDPSKTMRLSTSFNVKKETVHNWRDYLRLHCHPSEKYAPEWPSNPVSFKGMLSVVTAPKFDNSGSDFKKLYPRAFWIRQRQPKKDIRRARPTHGHELLSGMPSTGSYVRITGPHGSQCPHYSPSGLQVAGLQVLNNGKWLAVKPQPDAFVINIGDQIQALSNGKYKSVWHRAVVNTDKAWLSIASFLCLSDEADISAPKGLISGKDEARYRNYTYAEYYKKFWSRNLDQEHCLELFKN
ncbi:hypothetical protein CASFOL_028694 [Castilleja foliolosa]|uniref:Uncharacterized protein n=1 Tax=Castilleja foliolosa TaxID=1961234 RepID=A0ABD3CDF4_9LAMI